MFETEFFCALEMKKPIFFCF